MASHQHVPELRRKLGGKEVPEDAADHGGGAVQATEAGPFRSAHSRLSR